MKKSVICILIVLLAASCIFNKSDRLLKNNNNSPVTSIHTDDSEGITLFFTGNDLGKLKPCGCTGGQLGGLDRRKAVFQTVNKQQSLIIHTGSLVEKDSKQNRIKFEIIFDAMNILDYDLLSLSNKDIEIIQDNFGSPDYFQTSFDIISPVEFIDSQTPSVYTKILPIKEKNIFITIAAFDTQSKSINQAGELFPVTVPASADYKLNIFIPTQYEPELLDSISATVPQVDCIICPPLMDEPGLESESGQKPMVFMVGRYGRYVTKLHVQITDEDNLVLIFDSEAITKNLKPDESLASLYEYYQEIVAQSNLLAEFPRFPPENGLKYTKAGAFSCMTAPHCHTEEVVKWLESAHSNAYATLEEERSQYDPECVICHVIGLEFESGFISGEKTPDQKNVSCENCHGPCSEHIKNPYKVKPPITDPKEACIKCHTPEHSGDYAGHEEEKLQIIKHWTEPNEPGNVK